MTTKTKKTEGDLEIESFEARRAELEAARGANPQTASNKDVFLIAVPKDSLGTHWTACFISKPSRSNISTALALMGEKQPLQATEMILREHWIEGDGDILEVDELFYAAHMAMLGLINFRVGILKKN